MLQPQVEIVPKLGFEGMPYLALVVTTTGK